MDEQAKHTSGPWFADGEVIWHEIVVQGPHGEPRFRRPRPPSPPRRRAVMGELTPSLSEAELTFMLALLYMKPLPHADRAEDRVRQRLRKAGLVKVAQNPRRWVLTPAGRGALVGIFASDDGSIHLRERA